MKDQAARQVPPHVFSQALDFYLAQARECFASDIHFAPRMAGGEVRFRVSGLLQTFRSIETALEWDDLLRELKRRAGLIFQKGIAQDSRFSDLVTASDYRVSLVPVQLGSREAEQIVIRILPREAVFSLHRLGLPPSALEAMNLALMANQGLIIVTGPTGSGKTVTLMSALCAIERDKYSVLTLEEPVEYTLPGITQVQVSEKLSFAQGLRAFLRQDPDYILVGETRDRETAQALIQAASTGHVVLTTLHTNSAQEAFVRLGSLGVDEDLARDNATFVCAQRLVPKLCSQCSVFDEEGLRRLLALMPAESAQPPSEATQTSFEDHGPKKALGCHACHGTGVEGRHLLFEFMAPARTTSGKRQLVSSPSLQHAALGLVKKGVLHANELVALL